jgi:peptidyl-prolyl cis-trans isomerase C
MQSKYPGRFLLFLVSVFIIILFGLGHLCFAESGDTIVATINDIPITQSRIDALISVYKTKTGKKEVTREVKLTLLQNAIRHDLILLQDAVKELRNDDKIARKVKGYENNLIIARFLEDQVGSHLTVSEVEIKKYYKDNLNKFSSPPMVQARHVLLRTHEQARKVLQRLRNGEDFAQLAKDCSIDLPMALEGGSMGIIQKGKSFPELEKALFILNVGEVSDIVKTKFGYHILTVDKIIPVNFKPLEEVRDQIKTTILRQKEAKAFDEMAAKLEKDADIKIFEDRLN